MRTPSLRQVFFKPANVSRQRRLAIVPRAPAQLAAFDEFPDLRLQGVVVQRHFGPIQHAQQAALWSPISLRTPSMLG